MRISFIDHLVKFQRYISKSPFNSTFKALLCGGDASASTMMPFLSTKKYRGRPLTLKYSDSIAHWSSLSKQWSLDK